MAAFGKEVEKTLSDFVTCHGDSFNGSGLNSNCNGSGLRIRFAAGGTGDGIMDGCRPFGVYFLTMCGPFQVLCSDRYARPS